MNNIVKQAPVGGTPPSFTLHARVTRVGRYENGDWGLRIICGEAGFGIRVSPSAMQAEGVQVGDFICLEQAPGANPLCDLYTKVYRLGTLQ